MILDVAVWSGDNWGELRAGFWSKPVVPWWWGEGAFLAGHTQGAVASPGQLNAVMAPVLAAGGPAAVVLRFEWSESMRESAARLSAPGWEQVRTVRRQAIADTVTWLERNETVRTGAGGIAHRRIRALTALVLEPQPAGDRPMPVITVVIPHLVVDETGEPARFDHGSLEPRGTNELLAVRYETRVGGAFEQDLGERLRYES